MPFVKSKYVVFSKNETLDYVPGFSEETDQIKFIQLLKLKISFGSREGQLKTKALKGGVVSVGEFMAFAPPRCKIESGMVLLKARISPITRVDLKNLELTSAYLKDLEMTDEQIAEWIMNETNVIPAKEEPEFEQWTIKHIEPGRKHKVLYLEKLN